MLELPLAVAGTDDYDPARGRCLALKSDDDLINGMIEILDYADRTIPNIPPEEEKYLTAEQAAALRLFREELTEKRSHEQSNERFRKLQSRPLYYVWEVRETIAPTKEALAKIRTLDVSRTYKSDEAEKLDRAARSAYRVSDYAIHMQIYLKRSEWGISAMQVSQSQYNELLSGALAINTSLADYEGCKLARLIGRQPYRFDSAK